MIPIIVIRKYLVYNKSFPFYQTREYVFKLIGDSILLQIYPHYNPIQCKIWMIAQCVKIHNKFRKF